MKTIVNKQTEIQLQPGIKLKTSDLIKQSLNIMPEGGFKREDFKQRDRIEAYLDDESKEFNLEDADIVVLKKIVLNISWTFRHPDLSDFLDTIEAL